MASSVINLAGGQTRFTLAANKGKIRPKQAVVITFKFTKAPPEVGKSVRMTVAIIPDLNRNALIGWNVLFNFKMKQDFEKFVHSFKYPGSDDEVFVPFQSNSIRSKAYINEVVDIIARIEFEPTPEMLGENFDVLADEQVIPIPNDLFEMEYHNIELDIPHLSNP